MELRWSAGDWSPSNSVDPRPVQWLRNRKLEIDCLGQRHRLDIIAIAEPCLGHCEWAWVFLSLCVGRSRCRKRWEHRLVSPACVVCPCCVGRGLGSIPSMSHSVRNPPWQWGVDPGHTHSQDRTETPLPSAIPVVFFVSMSHWAKQSAS